MDPNNSNFLQLVNHYTAIRKTERARSDLVHAGYHPAALAHVPSESARVAEAEGLMAQNRHEAREQLRLGPPSGRPKSVPIVSLLRERAERQARVVVEQAKAKAWRAHALALERRRQERLANPPPRTGPLAGGGEIGAHQRALQSIARTNGGA
jgi:hypothetical protein